MVSTQVSVVPEGQARSTHGPQSHRREPGWPRLPLVVSQSSVTGAHMQYSYVGAPCNILSSFHRGVTNIHTTCYCPPWCCTCTFRCWLCCPREVLPRRTLHTCAARRMHWGCQSSASNVAGSCWSLLTRRARTLVSTAGPSALRQCHCLRPSPGPLPPQLPPSTPGTRGDLHHPLL
jgi:hypothetical protein